MGSGTGGSGLQCMRNRYYDPRTGRFTQEDPIGLAGGLNLYGFAAGDPVNFSDPFGLCPPPLLPVCAVMLGFAWFGGSQVAINAMYNRPLDEDVQQRAGFGMLAGLGASSLAAAPMAVADATATVSGPVIGQGTMKLIDALERAGPSMDARIQAVSSWLPKGQRALMTVLDNGGRMLSGGAGERARQIILNPDGSTVVKAWNVADKTWQVVRTIEPQ